MTLGEAQKLIEDTCNELATTSLQVIQLNETTDDKFTTGDAIIDETLGGGIRTGMVWEIAGERYNFQLLCLKSIFNLLTP